jgi:hypothetical protein
MAKPKIEVQQPVTPEMTPSATVNMMVTPAPIAMQTPMETPQQQLLTQQPTPMKIATPLDGLTNMI